MNFHILEFGYKVHLSGKSVDPLVHRAHLEASRARGILNHACVPQLRSPLGPLYHLYPLHKCSGGIPSLRVGHSRIFGLEPLEAVLEEVR